MRIEYMDNHLNADVFADYFDGLATPEQARLIELHLADCDACADLASRLFAGSGLLDQWNASNAKVARGASEASRAVGR